MKRKPLQERILDTAIQLFNKKGIEKISTYDIALKLGISQGNLTYHFPAKSDMIIALTENMIKEIKSNIPLHASSDFTIAFFYQSVRQIFRIHIKYRFLLMSWGSIISSIKKLKRYMLVNYEADKKLALNGLLLLEKNGYLKPQLKKDYLMFMYTSNLLGHYWIQDAAIYHSNKSQNEIIDHYIQIYFRQFIPFLTEKGKKDLISVMRKHKKAKTNATTVFHRTILSRRQKNK